MVGGRDAAEVTDEFLLVVVTYSKIVLMIVQLYEYTKTIELYTLSGWIVWYVTYHNKAVIFFMKCMSEPIFHSVTCTNSYLSAVCGSYKLKKNAR